MNQAVTALAALIDAAFADNPILPRGALVYRGSWETESLLRNLARVRDVPTDRFVEYHADSLPVFTPEGLRHVLPYYMRYSLLHPASTTAEFLLYHLAPEDTSAPYWRERLAVFAPGHREAICAFLHHLQDELVGEHFDTHFARARVVWECSRDDGRR